VLDKEGKPTGRYEFRYGAEGEKGYLKWVARNHPGHFMALYGKLIPLDVNAKVEEKPVVRYETVEERRAAMIAKGWAPSVLAAMEEAMEPKFLREAMAYALGRPDDARRCIDDAIDRVERSNEKWCEAEVHRIAGEIALKSPAPDTEKAQKYFERALAVARQQQAKSWELRAATSMARLWRDQGKRDEARDLLAPVYSWFTEGFDTLDLKEAKKLLDELSAMSCAVTLI
jgi:tetratricopeptide (TPR) repeat protein